MRGGSEEALHDHNVGPGQSALLGHTAAPLLEAWCKRIDVQKVCASAR
jgi:hypothetical protein